MCGENESNVVLGSSALDFDSDGGGGGVTSYCRPSITQYLDSIIFGYLLP